MTRTPRRRPAPRTVALTTLLSGAVLVPVLTGSFAVAATAGSVGASQVGTSSRADSTADSGADSAARAGAAAGALPHVTPHADRAVITLTGVTPTVIDGRGTVTLSGSVTAPASGPLTGLRLDVVLGSAPLTHRTHVDTWAKGTGHATGRTIDTTTLPDVAASRTTAFSATFAESAVATDRAFAALPISLEAFQQGGTRPTGVTRTFLSWNSRVEYEPLDIAVAVPVTLGPDLALHARDPDARAAAWATALGPGSRVDRIVEGTRGTPVTIAVDPVVVGASAAGAPGSGTPGSGTPGATPAPSATAEPGSPTGTPAETPGGTPGETPGATPTETPTETPGQGPTTPDPGSVDPRATAADERIAALHARMADGLRGRSVWALPYADADVAATVGHDPTNPLIRDLVARSSAVGQILGEPVRGDVAWPVDGLLPSNRDRGIQQAWSTSATRRAAGVVVNQAAITADSTYTPTARRVSANGGRLLAYDPRLSALLPERTDVSSAEPVQRFLAETLVLLGERPGTPRSVLVVAPRTYDPDPTRLADFLGATLQDVDWLHPVEGSALLQDRDGETTQPQEKASKPAASAAPRPALTRQRLRQLATQRDTLLRVAAVLREGPVFERTYRGLLDELTSVRWRYRPADWATLNNRVAAETKAATSAIRIKSSGRVNLFAETGKLRINVENGLDYAVENLRVVLVPSNPRLQVLEPPGPLSIAPGPSIVTINVPVRAVAAGRVDISVHLTTADGTRIGSAAIIPVSTNPLDSTIYWFGGVLAGLVLVVGVARSVRKGTSRIEEIGDLDIVAERDEAAENRKRT